MDYKASSTPVKAPDAAGYPAAGACEKARCASVLRTIEVDKEQRSLSSGGFARRRLIQSIAFYLKIIQHGTKNY